MKVQSDEYKTSFDLPDDPTIWQVLDFDGRRFGMDGQPPFVILWECAKAVITNWQSETLPDMNADLKTLSNPLAVRVIEWAGVTVSAWRRNLDDVPKN